MTLPASPSPEHIGQFAPAFLPDDPCAGECAAAEARVRAEIDRLGLHDCVAQLDRDGFTVVAPERLARRGFAGEVVDAIMRVAERRSGHRPDLAEGFTHAGLVSPWGSVEASSDLLLEDRVFEEALMNPCGLALITWLLGESCLLHHLTAMVKGPGGQYLPLHTDQNRSGAPEPFPAYSQVANATWALTPYSEENGSICFVPGSHRLCRAPTLAEATDLTSFEPVECPAGSLIVWHGNTWHGAVPRRTPGVRISLIAYFNRWYYPPYNDYRGAIPSEVLDRNGERFAILTNNGPSMWDPAGPKFNAARYNLFA